MRREMGDAKNEKGNGKWEQQQPMFLLTDYCNKWGQMALEKRGVSAPALPPR